MGKESFDDVPRLAFHPISQRQDWKHEGVDSVDQSHSQVDAVNALIYRSELLDTWSHTHVAAKPFHSPIKQVLIDTTAFNSSLTA